MESTGRVHLLVSLVQTYEVRRERVDSGGTPSIGFNDVELKMYLELSLNALKRLVLTLRQGETISAIDIATIYSNSCMLVESAVSELIAMYRCRGGCIIF